MEQDSIINESASANNPFRGALSYNSTQADEFFGRDEERNVLLLQIENNTLSLLYSRSGMGKSSLLMAGVQPVLAQSSKFFPVYINVRDAVQGTLSDYAAKRINEEAKKAGIEVSSRLKIDEIGDELRGDQHLAITELLYLKTFRFSDEKRIGKEAIPVIIFDQFEEIFSKQLEPRNIPLLVKDIGMATEGKIPAYLENAITKPDIDVNPLFELMEDLSSTKWYRFLFSFREEFLTSFNTLKEEIPSIFYANNHLFLQPFDLPTGKAVIEKIAAKWQKFPAGVSNNLAEVIAEDSPINHRKEINPFILSLTGYTLYPKIINNDELVCNAIKNLDKNLVKNVAEQYCQNVFKSVSAGGRKFVEEKLITRDNKRTIFPVNNIPKNKEAELRKLDKNNHEQNGNQEISSRYLSFGEHLGAKHVEILHDRLMEPLLASREKRHKKEKILRYIYTVAGLLLVTVCIFMEFYSSYSKARNENAAYSQFLRSENKMNLDALKRDPSSLLALKYAVDYYVSAFTTFKGRNIECIDTLEKSILGVIKNKNLHFSDELNYYSPNEKYRYNKRNDSIVIEKIENGKYIYYFSLPRSHHSAFIMGDRYNNIITNDAIVTLTFHNNIFENDLSLFINTYSLKDKNIISSNFITRTYYNISQYSYLFLEENDYYLFASDKKRILYSIYNPKFERELTKDSTAAVQKSGTVIVKAAKNESKTLRYEEFNDHYSYSQRYFDGHNKKIKQALGDSIFNYYKNAYEKKSMLKNGINIITKDSTSTFSYKDVALFTTNLNVDLLYIDTLEWFVQVESNAKISYILKFNKNEIIRDTLDFISEYVRLIRKVNNIYTFNCDGKLTLWCPNKYEHITDWKKIYETDLNVFFTSDSEIPEKSND